MIAFDTEKTLMGSAIRSTASTHLSACISSSVIDGFFAGSSASVIGGMLYSVGYSSVTHILVTESYE